MTKRTRISILALILCIAMCLSLGACGSSSSANKGNNSGVIIESTTDKINAYISSVRDQIDSLNDTTEGILELKMTARGKSLVYSYQYTVDDMDYDLVAEVLSSSLDSSKSAFIADLTELRKTVPEAESLIVEYLDIRGNVIVSREFK